MITQGSSYMAVLFGASTEPITEDHLGYLREGGLGYFRAGLLDQHFSYRGREARLIRLLADTHSNNGLTRAFGVDEDSALVIPDLDEDRAYAIGVDGVVVIELPAKFQTFNSSELWRINGVRISYLTADDSINLRTGEIQFAPWKRPLTGRERFDLPLASTDVFSTFRSNDGEFLRIAQRLFDSRLGLAAYGVTSESEPIRYEFSLSRGFPGAEGVQGANPRTGREFLSYRLLHVDLAPVENASGASKFEDISARRTNLRNEISGL